MDKQAINIGLLGMGTVGTGVVRILTGNAANITQKVGLPINIKKILVRNPAKTRKLLLPAGIFTTDPAQVINDPDINIIVEVLGGEQPAADYILQALSRGKHVVTANKDVMARYGRELFAAAETNRVDLLFEASVGGGIPIVRPLKQCLAANRIQEVIGIVNGTTNYMLTRMTAEGADFAAVLKEAQARGYAESDPTADVGGFDAARKIAILASIAFGTRIGVDDVYTEGITAITAQDIAYARELGFVIKLLAVAKEVDGAVDVRVHPAFISARHPLAAVSDVFNAIFVKGDAVGETMFYGRGAGELPTASAVTADIIDIARDIHLGVSSQVLCTCFHHKPIRPVDELVVPFYIRLLCEDKPGVLASIAGAFGAHNVSLHSVIQKRKVGDSAEVVLVTYEVTERNLRAALARISALDVVHSIANVIRVEGGDGA